MRMKSLICLSSALVVAFASGCATDSYTDENFGSSVRQMIRAQIYDPVAAERPSPDPVTGLDGQQAGAILEQHRGAISKPQEVARPIEINVTQ